MNPTAVDHSTDTYDTIDWLVKNIPESNGKVGILGISYDGFTSLMALVNPHPALRAAVPINAMVDGWMGDDWFHKGAFRQDSLTYFHDQEATRGSDIPWWSDHYDDYDTWLAAGSAGEMARRAWPRTSRFRDQAHEAPGLRSHSGKTRRWTRSWPRAGVTVPTMLVHSLWDQEDIYGNIALYKALEAQDADHSNLFLVHWALGFTISNGSTAAPSAPIQFGSDTAAIFPQASAAAVLRSFSEGRRAAAQAGAGDGLRDRHQSLAALSTWPQRLQPPAAASSMQKLYLQTGGKLRLGGVLEQFVRRRGR